VYVSVGSCSSAKNPCVSVVVWNAPEPDTAVIATPLMPAFVCASTMLPRSVPMTPPAVNAGLAEDKKSAATNSSAIPKRKAAHRMNGVDAIHASPRSMLQVAGV